MVGKRVKASSILEVVVSMVLIVIVFGIAMMIIANVTRTTVSGERLHAQAVLKNFEISNDPINSTLMVDSVWVEQSVEPYRIPGLYEVHLTGYNDHKQKLAEIHRIIIHQ